MSDLLFSTICPHCDELFNDSVGFMTHEGQCEYEANERRLELIGKVIENHRGALRAMDDNIRIGFKRLDERATIPTKAHPTDSGFDLYASEDVIIEPGETVIVPTGIAVGLPKGYEAQVRPRSGVTAKTKLRVQLGTIDNGYRGELDVIVDNIYFDFCDDGEFMFRAAGIDEEPTGEKYFPYGTYKIRKGDRIAQLVIQHLPETEAVEITEFSDDSERGASGFGSSGV